MDIGFEVWGPFEYFKFGVGENLVGRGRINIFKNIGEKSRSPSLQVAFPKFITKTLCYVQKLLVLSI